MLADNADAQTPFVSTTIAARSVLVADTSPSGQCTRQVLQRSYLGELAAGTMTANLRDPAED